MRFMMKVALWAAFFVSPVSVLAQGAVQQSGPVVVGNVPQWYRNGIIGDSGVSVAFIKSLQAFNPGQTVTSLNMTATLSQTILTTWSGGYPGMNNIALYSIQSYTGTPTGAYHGDFAGSSLPFNLVQVDDSVNFINGAGGPVSAFEVRHYYGGGTSAGPRSSFLLDSEFIQPMPLFGGPGYPFMVGMTILENAAANAGGVSGGSRGESFTIGGYCRIQEAATFWHGFQCEEWDYQPAAGANYDYAFMVKYINGDPTSGHHANVFETIIGFGGGPGTMNNGISFGGAELGFPISPTGTAIGFAAGSLASVIDAHLVTASAWLLAGPNNSGIDGANFVHTDEIRSVSGNVICVCTAGGNPLGSFTQSGGTGGSPASYPFLTSGPSVGLDTGGVGSALVLGGINATSVLIASSGIQSTIRGPLALTNASTWVATSNCGSLASSTKCLAVVDPNGNTVFLPVYGTF